MTHVYKKLDNSDNLSFTLIIELMQSSIYMKYSILILGYDIYIVQNNGILQEFLLFGLNTCTMEWLSINIIFIIF